MYLYDTIMISREKKCHVYIFYFNFKSAIKAKWSEGNNTLGRPTCLVTTSCVGMGKV